MISPNSTSPKADAKIGPFLFLSLLALIVLLTIYLFLILDSFLIPDGTPISKITT